MEDEERTEEQFVDDETFMVDDDDVQYVEQDNADPITITINEPPDARRY